MLLFMRLKNVYRDTLSQPNAGTIHPAVVRKMQVNIMRQAVFDKTVILSMMGNDSCWNSNQGDVALVKRNSQPRRSDRTSAKQYYSGEADKCIANKYRRVDLASVEALL